MINAHRLNLRCPCSVVLLVWSCWHVPFWKWYDRLFCSDHILRQILCVLLQDDDRDAEMQFCFRAFVSSKRLRQSLKSYASVPLAVLLALIIGTIVFTASLHYPYTLLTVDHTISPDRTLNTLCGNLNNNATLVRYDILKPLERPNFECIQTKTSPSVAVCLFDIWHDVYVSRSLHSAGIWEPYLVNEFTETVRRGGPNTGVCIFFIQIILLIAASRNSQYYSVSQFISSLLEIYIELWASLLNQILHYYV